MVVIRVVVIDGGFAVTDGREMEPFKAPKDREPYKPRAIRGTPLGRFANKISFYGVILTSILGAYYLFDPYGERKRERVLKLVIESPEEREMKMKMSLLPHISSDAYREAQEMLHNPGDPFWKPN